MRIFFGMAIIVVLAGTASAQTTTQQLHDAQYPDVDIALGATIYASRCITCHGAQGDGISGVNLRSGKFRKAITDWELARYFEII